MLFRCGGRRQQALRLATARGAPRLHVRLARPGPYPLDSVRAVTLVAAGGGLWLDVTALVGVADHDLDPARVAGVDIGLIHPYAVAGPDRQGLLVSGEREQLLTLSRDRDRGKPWPGNGDSPRY